MFELAAIIAAFIEPSTSASATTECAATLDRTTFGACRTHCRLHNRCYGWGESTYILLVISITFFSQCVNCIPICNLSIVHLLVFTATSVADGR